MKKLLLLAGVLSLALTSAVQADVQATGAGGTIADDATPFISDITITDNSIINNATFCLDDIQHTWVGDLVVTVTHIQSGLSATLFDRVDQHGTGPGDSSNLDGTYVFDDNSSNSFWTEAANGPSFYVMTPGTYQSSDSDGVATSLNDVFAGQNATGTWRLEIVDADEKEVGQLANWSLEFQTTAIPEPSALGVLALGMAMVIRRKR